ncbi:MAG: very short patch repair endonuclease [Candidatus Staskawiczbacteria bacterium]|nr:very short patch repair endonuclease [Candidatus Staskawiczbacteria bacterium]
MTDKITKKERSSLMAKIKSKETKLEKDFRKLLWKDGFRYRKNSSKHFGKPDIVVASKNLVVFIDSCFWHGCKKHCRIPEANREYWVKKINGNRNRDKKVNVYYKKIGWKIIRIWEHNLKIKIGEKQKRRKNRLE